MPLEIPPPDRAWKQVRHRPEHHRRAPREGSCCREGDGLQAERARDGTDVIINLEEQEENLKA